MSHMSKVHKALKIKHSEWLCHLLTHMKYKQQKTSIKNYDIYSITCFIMSTCSLAGIMWQDNTIVSNKLALHRITTIIKSKVLSATPKKSSFSYVFWIIHIIQISMRVLPSNTANNRVYCINKCCQNEND